MAKLIVNQTNFTAGELSPKAWGRNDIGRYSNGAEIIENAFVSVLGGAYKRWGTRYRMPAKFADKLGRLVPFIFSRTDAFWLEFGDQYMRVHGVNGVVETSPGVPYEIATPYTAAQVPDIDWSQAADTMIIWHPSHAPRRLRRFAATQWVLDVAPFDPAPFDELGDSFAIALTLSAATVGTGRTVTAASSLWLAADVGRDIVQGASRARITAAASGTSATADVLSAFASTTVAANEWTLAGSPQAVCTPSADGPVGATINLTLGKAGWRPSDVGRIVAINQGLCKITTYTSATVVSARVLVKLNTTVGAEANSWTLNSDAWNAGSGYPSTGTFHAQRLLAAGSPRYPQTVWGSGIGDFYAFVLGDLDTDAFEYDMAGDDVSIISYLTSMEALVALSYGGELTMEGGVEKPITPTNIRAKPRTNNGCAKVRPVRVGAEEIFVQRTGNRLRAASYSVDSGAWACPDMTVLAEHLVAPGVVSLSWHKEPGSLLFAARADGKVAACTYDRDQDVVAWTRVSLAGGVVESLATIPAATGDRTMMIVRRVIDGNTVRYLEVFDTASYTDCAIHLTGTASAVWSGLAHLEGQTVAIRADGIPQSPQEVTGGQITLQRTATAVEIGLPISMRIRMLPPEVGGGSGSGKGAEIRVHEAIVQVLDTIGLTINGEQVPFRTLDSAILDTAIEPFTGTKSVKALGWERGGGRVEITHDDPLPAHVLSVVRKLTANEG